MLKASTSNDEVVAVVFALAVTVPAVADEEKAAEGEEEEEGVARWVRPSQVAVEAARCCLKRSASCFPLMTTSPMNSP